MNHRSEAEAEANRLKALQNYRVLDTPAEEGFDELTRLAAQICGVPMALVSFFDAQRLWVKSRVGCDLTELPRHESICSYVLKTGEVLVVENTVEDPRFAALPLVTGGPKVRFFAGVALRGKLHEAAESADYPIGVLCVMDDRPRKISEDQAHAL